MDAVLVVAHRDPPAPVRIVAPGDAGPVHDVPRDVGPLGVGQRPVARRDPQRAVPDLLGGDAADVEGARSAVASSMLPVIGPKSRIARAPCPARTGGSRVASSAPVSRSHAATRCGFSCSLCRPGPYR